MFDRILFVVAGLYALSGCATPNQIQTAPPLAAAAPAIDLALGKKMILSERARLWKDADSIKDAKIGQPLPCKTNAIMPGRGLISIPATCMCIELNARNSFGGYAGITRNAVVFSDDPNSPVSVENLYDVGVECAVLASFPELNGSTPRNR
jgi:hypothetical protein